MRRTRKIAGSIAACLMALVVMIGVAPPASATASGCSGWACVKVVGEGTWVNQVQAYTNKWQVLSFYGHFRIWGHGFSYTTPDRENRHSVIHYRNLNRHLPNGSKVCSEAFQKNSNGSYTRRGLPCVTIKA